MTTTEPQGGSTDHHTVFLQAQTTKLAETGQKKKGRGISTEEPDTEEKHQK